MAEHWRPSVEQLKQAERPNFATGPRNSESNDAGTMSRTASWMVSSTQLKTDEQSSKSGQIEEIKPTHEQAIARHRDNLSYLYKLIQQGQHETHTEWGSIWPNSCRWLLTGKTKLHVLTPTHDSKERATALGHLGEIAYFGIDHSFPSTSDYNHAQLKDSTNIEVRGEITGGFRSRDKVVVVDPIQIKEYASAEAYLRQLKITIMHEVQHDADHLDHGVLNRYESEFHAYWVSKQFEMYSAKSGSADATEKASDGTPAVGFDNARQQAIFLYLYNSPSYPFVSIGFRWDLFRKHVLSLKSAKGINIRNSPEIDNLYLSLKKRPFNHSEAEAALRVIQPRDRAALAAPGMQDAWNALVAELPDAEERKHFAAALVLPPQSQQAKPSKLQELQRTAVEQAILTEQVITQRY